MYRPRHMAGAGLAIASLAVLGACSGASDATDDGASASGSSDDVIELSYWAWPAESQAVVDQFNESHPNIHVTYTDAGGGDDSSTKLLAAVEAGDSPDVVLVEYLTLPSLVVSGAVTDITPYVSDIQDSFTEGTWAQTTFDGTVYGIPQDVGPMAFVYRSDRFEEFGFDAPATWAEFRADAEAIHAAEPDTYIASLPPAEFGFWAGVATQNGGEWWSIDGDSWKIGIADEASLEVADFFEEMYNDGLISTQPLLTPEYNVKLNDGSMLSWPSAVWAPGVIYSVAEDTAGGWSMAPLPEWTEGESAVPYQGGSALIVPSGSEHPEAAAEFAAWLNASEEGNSLMINSQALYPASIVGQEMTLSNDVPALMPQQTDFWQVAADISSDTTPVTWGPNVNVARTTFEDAFTKAIENGTPWRDVFIATQEAVIADLEASGYSVVTD